MFVYKFIIFVRVKDCQHFYKNLLFASISRKVTKAVSL